MPDATPRDEDDLAAAEVALRLIDGEDCIAAQARAARDTGFVEAIERWRDRLSPLFGAIDPVPPPPGVWNRLQSEIARSAPALRRRLRRWQWATGGVGALAAGLALMLALPRPAPVVPTVATPAVLPALAFAQLADDRGTPMLAVGIERDSGRMRIRVHAMPQEARTPELWLIPKGGTPHSLGLIAADGRLDVPMPVALRGALADQATLAVSMERPGGAPHAAPAGPIVATGMVVTL